MTSNAVCDYINADWERNSLGQDACQVYAQLQGVCNPSFTITSVVSTDPPYLPQNNACGCNVVAYNLMAGCGWCQSTILTTWWLTEAQWAGNCSSFDSTGIPSSVSTSGITFPAWAFLLPSGTTWSPSAAQAVAATASPSSTRTTSNVFATTNPGFTTNPIFTSTPHATSTYYYWSGDDNLSHAASNAGKVAGAVVGVILGLQALAGIAVIIIYFVRQSQRQAWYRPMGQYYAAIRSGGAPPGGAQPFVYNGTNQPYENVKTPMSNASSGFTYQPPPPEQPYNAGYTNVPPGAGNTNSMYGAPNAATGGAGYRGYAEAH